MKKIIVPIDFSDHSEYALKAAALLAKRHQIEIVVLHMLDISIASLSESASDLQAQSIFYLKLAEKRFSSFLKKDYLKEVKVTPIIKHYLSFREINDIAEEVSADLIIMSSHGASGIKELFVGSNTEKVVRFSSIPVLILKEELFDLNFEDVVYACDFSEKSIPAYKKTVKLMHFFGAELHLLYVNLPNDSFKTSAEMKEMAANFLTKADQDSSKLKEVTFECELTIEKGILKFSHRIGADLIAISTHGRKGLSHIFEGSVAEDLGNHSMLPVITIKI
ncbi:Putative universal stress protein [Polaribacter huanghezhanensis]|uniref:universal stress protein n=1 Tax=Polaribacter huanghezhanensis TaxID=1354726 RepID=UPI002647E6F8|nr:universal stress protein [Polaribacter huanghezhanensis]WKD85812.1 Putative universal stress protein [Polaribacter huanghezhanensis]